MLSSIVFTISLLDLTSGSGEGWYDIKYDEQKKFSDGNGFFCKLFVNNNQEGVNLKNMETITINKLNLSLESHNNDENGISSIEIVHNVINTGSNTLKFQLSCYSIVSDENFLWVHKTVHGRGIEINNYDDKHFIIYLDGSNTGYTYPDQMYFADSGNGDHYRASFDESTAKTEVDSDILSYAVGFRWNLEIKGLESKKLAVRISFTSDQNKEFPTLMLEKNAEISGYTSDEINFSLNAENLENGKKYKLMINKDLSNGWVEREMKEFNSQAKIGVNLNFDTEGIYDVRIQVVMKDNALYGTNTIVVKIIIKNKPTSLKLENVTISKVLVKSGKFNIKGNYITNSLNGFLIKVDFGVENILQCNIRNTKLEDNFDQQFDVPNLQINNYNVNVYGYDSTTKTETKKIEFVVNVTAKPSIKLTYSNDNVFKHEDNFTIKYEVEDDTTGNVSYELFNEQSPLQVYTQTNKSFEKTITIPSNIECGEYEMIFNVTDEFGVSNTNKFVFEIKNPPVINSVNLDHDIINVGGTINAQVNVTAKDKDDWFIYYKINGEIDSNFKVFTSTGSCYIADLEINCEKPGRKQLEFFVTNHFDLNNFPKYSVSNFVNKTVIFTDQPKLEFNKPEVSVYNLSEKISLDLIITDDTEGNISYSINDDEDNEYHKDFIEYNNTKKQKNVEIPIPSTLSYGKNYKLKIKIIDEFLQNSEEKSFDFSIKHVPVIDESKSSIETLLEKDKEYTFTILINDEDQGKPLYVYYCFNNGRYDLFGESVSKGPNEAVSVTKTIKISINKGENQNISFYVVDTKDSNKVTKNAKSKDLIKNIIITEGPEIINYKLPETSFNHTDSISVELTIRSDENGKARFELNGSLIHEADFNTQNLNPTFDFKPSSYSYGEAELVFYLNYGNNQNSTQRKVKLMFRRKPSISNLQLNPNQIKVNGSTTLSGLVTDFDNSKELYVIIQVGNIKKRANETNSIISNGSEQSFSYTIEKLAEQIGNQLTVWVAEKPNTEYSDAPRYSVSDKYYVDYVISTPPKLQADYPSKKQYEWNETIHLTIHVNDDVAGKLVFQALDNDNSLIDFEKKEVPYDGFENKTVEIRINLEKSSKFVLNITAIGNDGGSYSLTNYEFTVYNKPKITNVEFAPQVVSPGSDVRFNCTFVDSNAKDNQFSIYIKFNDGEDQMQPVYMDEDEKTTHQINGTFNIPNTYDIGNNNVKFCINYFDLEYKEFTECKEYNITVTKPPSIEIIADDIVTEGEQLNFSVTIDDDEFIGIVNIYVGENLLKTLNYTNNKINESVTIPPEFSSYGTHTIKAQAIDRFGIKSSFSDYPFNFKHQPKLNNMFVTPDVLSAGDKITINGSIFDPDINKTLYLYCKFGENSIYQLNQFSHDQNKTENFVKEYIIPANEEIGNKVFQVWVTDSGSGPNMDIKYSTSIPYKTNITVILIPNINATLKSQYIQSNSSVTLEGYVECSSQATIHYWVDGQELTPDNINFDGNRFSLDNRTVKIPDNCSFGRPHTLTIQVRSYTKTSEKSVNSFYIKNKPNISDIFIGNEQYLLSSSEVEIGGILNDRDNNKILSFYTNFNGSVTNIGKIKSNGSQRKFTFNYTLPDIYGQQEINIWCSDQQNTSELDESENITKEILLTYKPIINLTNEIDNIFQFGEILPINITAVDDSNCTIKLTYNENHLDEYDRNVTSNNEHQLITIEFIIPDDSIKERNILKITSIDQYQKETQYPIVKAINIKNKPLIEDLSIDSNELFYDETASLSFLFTNIDTGFRYFFVKVGSNDPEMIHEMYSQGEKRVRKELKFKDLAKYGQRTKESVKFWVQEDNVHTDNLLKNSKSDEQTFIITIKYRPSIEIIFPEKRIYHENSSIKLSGDITAESDYTVKIMIDNNPVYEFNQPKANKSFSREIKIPNNVTHGIHKLSLKVIDAESIESSEKFYAFFIKNNPSLYDVKFSNTTGLPGTKITITGKAFDPDKKQKLYIYAKLEYEQNFTLIATLNSTAQKQSFEYEFEIKHDAKIGITKIILYAIDDDELKSSQIELKFEVLSNLIHGVPHKSPGSIIAGVICSLLVIAIIVGIVVYLKMKGTMKEENEDQEHSDIAEAETIDSNASQNEQTTMDNPLFTLNGRDDPIFDSDEITNDEVNEELNL